MRKLLTREQLDEIRHIISFLPIGRVAGLAKQLMDHVDAQEDLIKDQATTIAHLTATQERKT